MSSPRAPWLTSIHRICRRSTVRSASLALSTASARSRRPASSTGSTSRNSTSGDTGGWRGPAAFGAGEVAPHLLPDRALSTTSVDAMNLEVWTKLNGQLEQQGYTSDLLLGISGMVAYFSTHMTRLTGDLLATGTPPGVGFGKNRYMAPGDVLERGITSFGAQRPEICAWRDPTARRSEILYAAWYYTGSRRSRIHRRFSVTPTSSKTSRTESKNERSPCRTFSR